MRLLMLNTSHWKLLTNRYLPAGGNLYLMIILLLRTKIFVFLIGKRGNIFGDLTVLVIPVRSIPGLII